MKTPNILLSAIVLLGLQACAAPPEQIIEFETVKPGAAISLSHSAPRTMLANTYQTINLKINEAYFEGQMTLTVTPSEGLTLFGDVESKTFAMDKLSVHDWPIDVRAENDGIYFLNFFASTTSSVGRNKDSRNFSIRLDIGDITPEMRQAAFPENGKLSEDGKTRILEATEVIR